MTALRQAGRSDIFVALRGQVTQIAQAEERARLDGERRAAQQAAADRIAPTASGGRFQSERLSRSVVMLFNYAGSSTGSGFIVAPEIVVTNMHVVTPEGELYAVNDGSNLQARVRAQVIYRSDVHDIAILRVPGLTGQIVELAGPEPSRGADVWASGFPGLADRARQMDQNSQRIASMTRGIVSRVYDGHTSFSQGRGSPSRLVQHDANVFHGNSGGPLFDVCNRVIGVNTQIRNEDGLTVFYAVSATVLPYLLRQAGVTPRVSQSRC
jgi:S1-C subfamily serine protease